MKSIYSRQKLIFATIIASFVAGSLYLVLSQLGEKELKAPPKTLTIPHKIVTRASIPAYPTTIPGEVITLKKITIESAFDYYKMFSDDVRKYLEFPKDVTFGYAARYVATLVEKLKKGLLIAYNIWDNEENKLVGSIQIREKNEVDPGQLGMWLNEKYRGGGRIKEALRLISNAYFKAHPDTKEYIAHVRLWNKASARAMEKFGFKKIGDYIEDGKVTRQIFKLSRKSIQIQKHKKVLKTK